MGSKFLLGFVAVACFCFAIYEKRKLGEADLRIQSLEREASKAAGARQKLEEQLATVQTALDVAKAQLLSMSGAAKTQNAALTELEQELEAQRARTEQKRKEYQDLLSGHSSGDPDAASKTKQLNDEIAALDQRLKSTQQEMAYTKDEASSARQNQKNGAEFAMSQANSRIQTAQAALSSLKAQRAAVPHGRGQPDPRDSYASFDMQIAATTGQLNDLKAEKNRLQSMRGQDTSSLNGQIGAAVSNLSNEQNKIKHDLEARHNDLKRLQDVQGVSGRFDKERKALVQRLAGELQEETKKLADLEARVKAELARH